LLITGCASVPNDYPRTESTAFKNNLGTAAGKQIEEAAQQHPGESGFAIIPWRPPVDFKLQAFSNVESADNGPEEFIVAQRTASLACSICISQKYFVTYDCRTIEFMRDYLSPVPEY
jgi:hypothetical protein